MIGHECLHYIKNLKKWASGTATLKLDLNKAYDRVEWSFLEKMMLRLGFNEVWMATVMYCISMAKFSIIINGEATGLLFICAESLSSCLSDIHTRGLISSVTLSSNCPSLSHLFFADDNLVFFRANVIECARIKHVLVENGEASGPCINFSKFAMCVSPNGRLECKSYLQLILGVNVTYNIGNYVGLPLCFSMRKGDYFSTLKERIWKIVQGWRGNMFLVSGKEVIIKSIAQATPTYTMSSFKLPKDFCKDVERIIAVFLWGLIGGKRKLRWKRWSHICQPKEFGGLNFRGLENFNQALIAKQVWCLLKFPNLLVSKILKGCYFPDSDILCASSSKGSSYLWQGLLWGRNLFENGIRY